MTAWSPGWGASPEGSRPFLDALDLDTSATRRLWQSAETCLEQCGSLLSDLPGQPLRCVYERLTRKRAPPLALICIFLVV